MRSAADRPALRGIHALVAITTWSRGSAFSALPKTASVP